LGSTGVSSAEGNQWKEEKKINAVVLNRSNMHDYLPALKGVAQSLVEKWNDSATKSIPINKDVGHAAADSISRVALSKYFDFLTKPSIRNG